MQTENQRKSYYPNSQGLYSPLHEHDACGVGLVVDTKGNASHKIVLQGIEVLNRLMHRGAVGGDSQTGDGAGILVQMPDEFFRKVLPNLPERGSYAVGMVFLPQDSELAKKC